MNFSGAAHSVPPEKIQLTRALLLAAICQSYRLPFDGGLMDLDERVQSQIVQEYLKIYNDTDFH